MSTKTRLSASVDESIILAAQAAVAAGRATNLSTWVNDALHRQIEHERRMLALDDFLASYEAEHGEISDAEIRDASRRIRARAVVVRGEPRRKGSKSRRRAGGT
jgi:hypothetical protein